MPARREAFFDKFVQISVLLLFLLHPVLSARLLKLFAPVSFGGFAVLAADWRLGFDETAGYRVGADYNIQWY